MSYQPETPILGVIWIFQKGGRKFCMKSSILFFTIILSFLEKKFFQNSRFPVRSGLLLYHLEDTLVSAISVDVCKSTLTQRQ